MIASDLIREFRITVKTAIGQLEGVTKKIEKTDDPEGILLQLKAAEALVSKATIMLLDEVYRKALAEKISFAHQNCPGNCGSEDQIERLRHLFPQITPENLPERLIEAEELTEKIKEIISDKAWSTPPALPEIRSRNK